MRTINLSIRTTPEIKAMLKEIASYEGRSLSNALENMIRKYHIPNIYSTSSSTMPKAEERKPTPLPPSLDPYEQQGTRY